MSSDESGEYKTLECQITQKKTTAYTQTGPIIKHLSSAVHTTLTTSEKESAKITAIHAFHSGDSPSEQKTRSRNQLLILDEHLVFHSMDLYTAGATNILFFNFEILPENLSANDGFSMVNLVFAGQDPKSSEITLYRLVGNSLVYD